MNSDKEILRGSESQPPFGAAEDVAEKWRS
ncbi:hypothetical protein EDC91_14116 [Shewanella fodinae]|uniref:Uncharacterized protein n=1 Tax=Shewanella fodinae TaxID=552357 RepID=A0A4R2F1I0_9GAMM|nr:hypothetical protein EDC91_14116 [Shewanella fodinae]